MNKQFKNILVLIMLVFTWMPLLAKGTITTLTGKIKGFDGESIDLVKDLSDPNDEGMSIKVAKDGSFKATFELEKSTYDAKLYVGGLVYSFYMKPSGKYSIEIDASDENDESKYILSGSNSAENQVYKNYLFKVQKAYLFQSELEAAETFKAYNAFVDTKINKLLAELSKTTDPEFISVMKQRLNQENVFLKFTYELRRLELEAKNNGGTSNYKSDPDYDAYLSSSEWKSIDEKVFLNFKESFKFFALFVCPDLRVDEILKNLTKTLPTQNAINLYSYDLVSWFYEKGGKGDLDDVFEKYKAISTDTVAVNAIDEVRVAAKTFAKGQPALEFEMKDITGKAYKISDFKGKAVYIDVWATWCAPCKAEIPALKKLVEKYKDDKRIEFISVSIDAKRKTWEQFVGAEIQQWKQLIVDNDLNSDLCKKYKITSIPRFMLFDKEGKIVSVTAAFPSDETLVEIINEIL